MYANDAFQYHAKNGDYNRVAYLLVDTLANPFDEKIMKAVIKRKNYAMYRGRRASLFQKEDGFCKKN